MSTYEHLDIAYTVLEFVRDHFSYVQKSYIDDSINYIIEELKEARDGIKEDEEE